MGPGVLVDRRNGPAKAVALLKSRGYDLLKHDQVPVDKSFFGPVPGSPSAGQPL